MDGDKKKPESEKRKAKSKGGPGRYFLSFLEDSPFQKPFLLWGVSLLVAFMVTPSFNVTTTHYRVGDVADRNIKAPRDLLIEDEEATLKKRQEAVEEAPVVYDFDEHVATEALKRLRQAFASMRQSIADSDLSGGESLLSPDRAREASEGSVVPAPDGKTMLPSEQRLAERFREMLGVQVSHDAFHRLWEEGFSPQTEETLAGLARGVFEKGIVSNKALLLQTDSKRLVIRKIRSQKEEVLDPPYRFPDLEEARELLEIRASGADDDPETVAAMVHVASQILQPVLTFNRDETERRKQDAADSVKPVFIHLKKNEMLVREGEKVDAEDLIKLRGLRRAGADQNRWLTFLAILAFSVLAMKSVVRESPRHAPSLRMENRDYVFLAVLMVVLVSASRFTGWLADSMSDGSLYLSGKNLIYALPLTAGAMMTAVFFGVTLSLLFSLLLTLFVGMLLGADFELFLYFLGGCFVATHAVMPCRDRMAPIRAGLLTGVANMFLVVMAALLHDGGSVLTTTVGLLFGFFGGLFAGVLVAGLTPLAEMLFGYTTDTRLLELATMDQPLLQELMVQAPGTYHHSIIVGNMVEAAAQTIGANSLLAKVAGYYHDIGKIKKPLYFIENQFECENRHEKLAPSMSSLILISHVKEGIEMGRKNGLGKPILDIISQHHGTSLISFFYKKALEAREKAQHTKGAELPPIDIDDYRYPGPKPQTKEAGLVMLADIVEAACRSLSEPTPARIQGMVNKLINNAFIDGQLDECELTLKDMHSIARKFNQILSTVHHKRIEYPSVSSGESKGKGNEPDSHQRESRSDSDSGAKHRESGRNDLKRLGLH